MPGLASAAIVSDITIAHVATSSVERRRNNRSRFIRASVHSAVAESVADLIPEPAAHRPVAVHGAARPRTAIARTITPEARVALAVLGHGQRREGVAHPVRETLRHRQQ